MSRVVRGALGLWIMMSVGGCGAVTYVVAINDAAGAVEEARASGAGDVATGPAAYEYWMAVEHLNKAREFAGEAEYQTACDMAETATESGHRARTLTRQQHETGR